MNNVVHIANRAIGDDYPPYIIAELSGNHNGDIHKALELIERAKEAGADAVKLQTYTPDTMTLDCDKPDFKVHGGLWDGYTLYELYKWAQTPWEWHEKLFNKAKAVGITIFSSPFDETAVDFLASLDVPAYKIASFEMIDLPLIEKIAKTKKPVIMSTGMATVEEINEAVNTLQQHGNCELILLHCVSGYPTPAEEYCLNTIPDLARRFHVMTGLSDHTLGITTAITSIALGSRVIEKHVTLRRADGGPDAAFSLEPPELAQLCREAKIAWQALGTVDYSLKPAEAPNKKFRRSLYASCDITAGQPFTTDNIRSIRPGFGLAPKYLQTLLGKTAKCNIERGTALSWELVND